MRIEISRTISQDARRSLGFAGVAQLPTEQPPHHILEDLRRFFGQIFGGSSAQAPAWSSRRKPKRNPCRNAGRSAL